VSDDAPRPLDVDDRRTRRDRARLAVRSGPVLHQPVARADETSSFFHLDGVQVDGLACCGTACFVARHRDPDRWAEAELAPAPLRCAGSCHVAPALGGDQVRPAVVSATSTAIVLERIVAGPVAGLAGYRAAGGYDALETARSAGPDQVVQAIDASMLRGRGGAAFGAGRKWRAVRAAAAAGLDAVVVVNADEGDPGAYIDRRLLEDDPHAVLEGAAIAAHAVGARTAIVYVRAEYPTARAAIATAAQEATAAGALGELDVSIVDGHGSYVCGEETALIEAIEGRRPRVRPRPPYPAERGLHGRPTLVHNVETLVAVPWIVRHGGDAYAALGAGTSRGTKALSLNSLFARPGIYEVELGVPVRHVVEDLGGGLTDGALAGVIIGGPLAGVLPPARLDTPLTVDDLRAAGADLGHGGVVAFDEGTTVMALARHVFAFGAAESCGTCTPCRVGAGEVEGLLTSALGGAVSPAPRARFDEVVAALASTSLCGHGTGLAAFARSLVRHYPEEVARCLG
jgi:NADH:ubiquinone oxidoreductase subunit F (NADH-binding)